MVEVRAGLFTRITSGAAAALWLVTAGIGLMHCGQTAGNGDVAGRGGATAGDGGSGNGGGGGGTALGGTASGGATSNASGPSNVREFCPALNEAVARYQVRCLGGTVDTWLSEAGISACELFVRAADEGRVRYDAASAAQCLAGLSQEPCGYPYLSESGPCALALAGQRSVGGTCRALDPELRFGECAPGAYCQLGGSGPSASSACAGTCVAYGRRGAACGGEYIPPLCATGFSCSAQGVCSAEAKDGESCRPFPGAPRCGFQSYCDGGSDTIDGVCLPAKTSGPCKVGAGECAFGYVCPGATNGDVSSCVPRRLPGEPCTQGLFDCSNSCGEDGRCQLAAAVGQQCGIVTQRYVYCARGLFCANPDTNLVGRCTPQRKVGEVCGSAFADFRPECPVSEGRLGYCDGTTSQCALCE